MKESRYFELPFLFENFKLGKNIIELQQNKPYIFKDGVVVNALYGSNGGKLNGGRYMETFYHNEKEVAKFVYDNGIVPIIIMSNLLANEKDVQDKQAAAILDTFKGSSTMFCVANGHIEKWLEDEHNINRGQFMLSTTACYNTEELLNNINRYKKIVLSESLVNNWQTIASMPERMRGKLVICVNSCCPINCPIRHEHYLHISKLNIEHNASVDNMFSCINEGYGGRGYLFEIMKLPQFVTNDMIDTYVSMGINHFKIRGRGDRVADLIETMAYFLIRDEYKIEFREECYDAIKI